MNGGVVSPVALPEQLHQGSKSSHHSFPITLEAWVSRTMVLNGLGDDITDDPDVLEL